MIRILSLALALLLLSAVAHASADPIEVTSQAKAARSEFLLRATPPGAVATICLVDTGVDVNPDTAGVIGRLALSGDATDQSPTRHGTQMAMFIGGTSNGFGMVGLWPSARTLSVRANVAQQDTFTAPGYINGVKRCSDAAPVYGVKVVVMPFSSPLNLTPEEYAALADEVSGARETGISFVAAAGNLGGQPVGTPGNIPGILSVGASDAVSGALCGFSATGARLLAPGCSLDGADPGTGAPTTSAQGTSHAAVIAAAALAALRTWRPDLTPDAADRLLIDTARQTPSGPLLDLTAAYVGAGLGSVTATPTPTPTVTPTPTATPVPKQRFARPRITVRTRGTGARRTLTVKTANRPRGARLRVRVYVRRAHKLRRVAARTSASATIRFHLRSWSRVTAQFLDPSARFLPSRTRTVDRR